jgi:hypothetical protein
VNNELDGMWKEVVKAEGELVPVLNELSKTRSQDVCGMEV